MILAVDPGNAKAGYAVLNLEGAALVAGIAPIGCLRERLAGIVASYPASAIAIGRGTNLRAVAAIVRELGLPVHEVDEYETTRRARELYFADHPPRGIWRVVPLGLQVPPRPIDDYAAILIGRRFLAEVSQGNITKLKPPP